jgi:hypothetical protein
MSIDQVKMQQMDYGTMGTDKQSIEQQRLEPFGSIGNINAR